MIQTPKKYIVIPSCKAIKLEKSQGGEYFRKPQYATLLRCYRGLQEVYLFLFDKLDKLNQSALSPTIPRLMVQPQTWMLLQEVQSRGVNVKTMKLFNTIWILNFKKNPKPKNNVFFQNTFFIAVQLSQNII